MSCADEEFITSLIEKSERFVASEVAKVQKQLTSMKAKHASEELKTANLMQENTELFDKVQRLTDNVQGLTDTTKAKQASEELQMANLIQENTELKDKVNRLTDNVQGLTNTVENLVSELITIKAQTSQPKEDAIQTLEKFFRAGLNAVVTASGSAQTLGIRTDSLDITPIVAAIDAYAQPMQTSTTVAGTQLQQTSTLQHIPLPIRPTLTKLKKSMGLSCKRKHSPSEAQGSLKRIPPPSEAPGTYTKLQDLPDKITKKIRPFYTIDNQASKDLLNPLQRAFMKAKANECYKINAPITQGLVNQVIREGVEEPIWLSNFSPSPDLTLEQYITNCLKNEKKSILHKIQLADTDARIQRYLRECAAEPTLVDD